MRDDERDETVQQDDDPDWDRWEEDEERPPRRLGRAVPGWLPIAVIAVLVVLGGLWWGLTSGSPAPPPTATRPRVVSTLSVVATAPTVKMPSVQQGSAEVTPMVASTVAVPPAPPVGAIAVGKQVQVTGVGPEGVSLRFGGGLNYARAAILQEGTILTVLDKPANFNEAYPVRQDGYTWWRVQTANGTIGWVAENWLRVVNP
jgi:hypothetical protein